MSKISSGFVVKYLVFNYMATLFQAGRDAELGSDTVASVLGLEEIYEDVVAVEFLGKYDVLVFTTRADRKAGNVVSDDLAYGIDSDVYFIGGGVW